LARADNSERFSRGEMRESLFEGAGKLELLSLWGNAQNGFAQTEDTAGGGFEHLGGRIAGVTGDDNLNGVMREECGSEAVGGGEETILRGDAGEGFECFLREGTIAVVAGEGVEANERDGGDGIGTGRRGILKRLAADVEAAHGRGVGSTIEETAILGVAVPGYGEVRRAQGGFKVSRLERGFIGIEQGENAENLIVE